LRFVDVLTGYVADPGYWGDAMSHGSAFEVAGLGSVGFFF
jgi:hypothetical protein